MSSNSPNLKLTLLSTGEAVGSWGDTTNTNLQELEQAVSTAGTVDLAPTTPGPWAEDKTLTMAPGLSSTARCMALEITCTSAGDDGGGTYTVTLPAVSKFYIIKLSQALAYNGYYNGTIIKIKVFGSSVEQTVPYKYWYDVDTSADVFKPAGVLYYSDGTDIIPVSYNGVNIPTAQLGDPGYPPSATTYLRGDGYWSTPTSGVTTINVYTTNGLAGAVKGNGAGGFSNATAGTDYLAPPLGTSILKANSGGALANATAGSDYVAPGTQTTFTAKQLFVGSTSVLAMVTNNIVETTGVFATAAAGVIDYFVANQSVLYYTSNASANWAVNFRMSSGTSLNTAMTTGQSVTVVFMVTQGSTPYYNGATNPVQVDGTITGVTVKWQGGTAPTYGNPSGIDVYSYTIIKTATATFTVLASQTQFK